MTEQEEMERIAEGVLGQLHQQNSILACLCWELNTLNAILMTAEGGTPDTDTPADVWERIEWFRDHYEAEVIPEQP